MKGMNELRRAIAIDFDGCLCKNMRPYIGLPNFDAINAAIRAKQEGAALILWTCRVGERLEQAVQFCKNYGLEFDAVNENLPERMEAYQNDPRKVNADEYWDDLAVPVSAEAGAEWVWKDEWFCCPVCGAEAEVDAFECRARGKVRPARSNFCPQCGAKLRL